MDSTQEVLGFIGLGVMGSSMAGHLLKAGYPMHAYTRSKAKARSLLEAGASWEESPAALAPKCHVIFTMVGYPSDVEEVYFGPEGLIENAVQGTILVDCTTSRPDLARRIAEAAKAKGIAALDAPVSGGDIGAKNAALTIMVGGEARDFESVRGLLGIMGSTVIRQGGSGAGQHTKMANQIAIAANLAGAVEAVTYARSAGLDPKVVLASIGSGSAGSWQLNNMVPRMLEGNFEPGFYVKHLLKDLRIALDSAHAMKLDLPLLGLAERLFADLKDAGYGDKGTQALYLLYERLGREGKGELKARGFDPAPEAIVSEGAFAFGRYGTPFRRANMLDVHRPYHYPIPRRLKNWRLKEWQAYQFGDEKWFFFASLYNVKVCSLVLFIAYDRERRKKYQIRRVLPGSMFHFPESLSGSSVYYRGAHNYLESTCDYEGGKIQLTVVRGARSPGRRFSGRFSFACAPKAAAPSVVCLPLGLNRAMYSTKILMPMEGEFSLGGESWRFSGPSSMGIIDDHKAYYPYHLRYDWVTGFGIDAKGRRVGFNLTDNAHVRDPARYNENCLWINNRVWPLPPVKVTRPQGNSGEWIIQDTEGMVDLVFVPELTNDLRFNLGVIESDYSGPLGSFRGFVKGGDGSKIQAELLYGAGEKEYLRA